MTDRDTPAPRNPGSDAPAPEDRAGVPLPLPEPPMELLLRTAVAMMGLTKTCRTRRCRRQGRCTGPLAPPPWPRCTGHLTEETRAWVPDDFAAKFARLGRAPDPWPEPEDGHQEEIDERRRAAYLLETAFGFDHPLYGARILAWIAGDPEQRRYRPWLFSAPPENGAG